MACHLWYWGVPTPIAGAEAGGTAHEDFAWGHALLHEAHVKGHEERGRSGAAAGGFGMAWGTGVGADDDVILGLRHGFSFLKEQMAYG